MVVQPLLVVAIRQSAGRSHSVYQLARWYYAAKMIKGGIAQPRALTPYITIAHSQLLGWASFALLQLSEVVTTIPTKMTPIINLVSSKL